MIQIDVIKFLEKKGYKTVSADWYTRIKLWGDWYAGDTEFHKYSIYNGREYIPRKRKTLKMAKKIAEDKADLLLNEKVEICVGSGGGDQEYVDAVLEDNNFRVSGNQLLEFTAALGTGAFVEYLEADEPRIDFVQADCIYPLAWRNGRVISCAFASAVDSKTTYVNIHVLENGKYTVYNHYVEGEDREVPLPDGMAPEWKTGRDLPLFQIVKLNIANNFDRLNPMGVPAFANAIDTLQALDLIYDSYFNEFKLGKKRVFVNDSMLKINVENGKQVPVFDANDTEFYGLPGEAADDISKNLHEVNGELRADAHRAALQDNLDLLSDKAGFGRGYYKFDADGVKTATEVISQNSKLYRKIKRDEIILGKAMADMVRAVLFLGKKNPDAEIVVNFDDSIVEDVDAEAKRAMLELQAGVIDAVLYHQRVYKLTPEAAQQLVAEIASRAPAQEDFTLGGDGGDDA